MLMEWEEFILQYIQRKISEVILYIISISLHCLNSLFETKSGLYGKK